MSALWSLLLEAQNSQAGIPQALIDEKKEEMRRARAGDTRALDERDRRARLDDFQSNDRGGYRGGRGRGRGRGRGGYEDDRGGRARDNGWGGRGGGTGVTSSFSFKSFNPLTRVVFSDQIVDSLAHHLRDAAHLLLSHVHRLGDTVHLAIVVLLVLRHLSGDVLAHHLVLSHVRALHLLRVVDVVRLLILHVIASTGLVVVIEIVGVLLPADVVSHLHLDQLLPAVRAAPVRLLHELFADVEVLVPQGRELAEEVLQDQGQDLCLGRGHHHLGGEA